MAPHDCFKNDMTLIEKETTYDEEAELANEEYQQAVLEDLQQLKYNIELYKHQLLEFESKLSQNQIQEEFEKQNQKQIQDQLDLFQYDQQPVEKIREEFEKLRIREKQLHGQIKQQEINEVQEPQVYKEIRQLNHGQLLIGLQISVLYLKQKLHEMRQRQQVRLRQQQMDHQIFLDELAQQMFMQRLDQELMHLQLDLQIDLFQPLIDKLFKQPEISQQTQLLLYEHIEELHEVKHQLNILLVYLQQVQLEYLSEQVEQRFYQQQEQYPQQNQENLKQIQEHIERIKQLKQQRMPGKQQLLLLVIVVVRQLHLQQHLDKIKFQLQLMEFEQQLPQVKKQIDILEKQLPQLQPEHQLNEQLELVKQKLNYMQDYAQIVIVELEHFRESIHQRLERPRTTRSKLFEKGLEKISNHVEKLQFQAILQAEQGFIQEEFREQLRKVQNEVYQLQQQIEEQQSQEHSDLLFQI